MARIACLSALGFGGCGTSSSLSWCHVLLMLSCADLVQFSECASLHKDADTLNSKIEGEGIMQPSLLTLPSCAEQDGNLTCSSAAGLQAWPKWPIKLEGSIPPSNDDSVSDGNDPMRAVEEDQVADDICIQCPDELDDSEFYRHIAMAVLGAGSYLLWNSGSPFSQITSGHILKML